MCSPEEIVQAWISFSGENRVTARTVRCQVMVIYRLTHGAIVSIADFTPNCHDHYGVAQECSGLLVLVPLFSVVVCGS